MVAHKDWAQWERSCNLRTFSFHPLGLIAELPAGSDRA